MVTRMITRQLSKFLQYAFDLDREWILRFVAFQESIKEIRLESNGSRSSNGIVATLIRVKPKITRVLVGKHENGSQQGRKQRLHLSVS
jgi:hypothetical protein